MKQQIAIFFVVFFLCQVAFAWFAGSAITMAVGLQMAIVSAVVTAIYALLLGWIRSRRGRGK